MSGRCRWDGWSIRTPPDTVASTTVPLGERLYNELIELKLQLNSLRTEGRPQPRPPLHFGLRLLHTFIYMFGNKG